MRIDIENHVCEQEEVLMAYLYNEGQSTVSRDSFESHLSGCASCIGLFAEISDARFSVLEWQRGEFAEMPTPAIVVPYEEEKVVASGWFAPLIELIRFPVWGTVAAMAFVAVAITGGYFLRSVPPAVEVASVSSPGGTSPVVSELPIVAVRPETPGGPFASSTGPHRTAKTSKPATKASDRGTSSKVRPLTAGIEKRPDPLPARMDETQRKPALATFEDDVDDMPRLADLLDDGGV